MSAAKVSKKSAAAIKAVLKAAAKRFSVPFAPGPWRVTRGGMGSDGAFFIVTGHRSQFSKERTITIVSHEHTEYRDNNRDSYPPRGYRETTTITTPIPDAEANANLIAAAPDLFLACRAAEALLSKGGTVPINGTTLQTVRDALAKAEGKSK